MSDDLVLHLERLKVETIKGAVLVDDVDVTLKRGEILGLIGESGAGKSTIGLASMAYARAGCRITGGNITINGTELRASTAAAAAQFPRQEHRLYRPERRRLVQSGDDPDGAGLRGAGHPRRDDASRRREAYARAPVPHAATARTPRPSATAIRIEVSGGQLQRAMAAMAMSCRPDIIVLDEPTTALDVTTQIEVLALLRDLIREFGTAGLYITHDLAVVAQIAHRIMVLRHGKMVEVGDAQQVLEQPATPYATALVNERREAEHIALIDPPKDAKPVLEHHGRRGRLSASMPVVKNINLIDRARRDPRGRRRIRLRQELDGARRRRAAAALDRRRQARRREPLPPALAQRPRDDPASACRWCIRCRTWRSIRARRSSEIIGRPVAFYLRPSAQRGQGTRRRALEPRRPAGGFRRPPSRPAVGRPEAARLHRAGARGRARPHHLRRADLGARSAGRRRGAEAAAAPAGRARPRLHVHHP